MEENKLVGNEEWLYRRAYLKYMYPNGSATSRAFKLRPKDDGQLSVDIASLTSPEVSIGDQLKFGLLKIKNESVIQCELKTYFDAVPGNQAHALIVGMEMEDEVKPALLAEGSQRVWL
ncbi:MAG: hypothetical protein ABI844_01260 [Saprospiraceae bacterium]